MVKEPKSESKQSASKAEKKEKAAVVEKKIEKVVEFKQALRIFKKDNSKASTWYDKAVEVFCKKRLGNDRAYPLDKWLEVLSQY